MHNNGVHHFNAAACKDGANFNFFICWVATQFVPQGSIKFSLL